MSNKVDKIYRAYSAKSDFTNQGKLNKIIALAKVYKQHFNVASSYYCSHFYRLNYCKSETSDFSRIINDTSKVINMN